MKINLDRLENSLQKLIENSSSLLSGKSASKPVAHRLVQSMFELLEKQEHPTPLSQLLFTIFLPAESYLLWKDNQALLSSLSSQLEDITSKQGIVFDAAPVIRVSLKDNLRAEDVEVSVTHAANSPQQTSAMEVGDTSLPKQSPVNAFLIVNGTETFPLTGSVVNIGRRETNQLVINDPRVSRNHAQLRAVHGVYILFDLNSTGGTYVNGMRVYQQNLQAGDVISLAGVALVYGEDTTNLNPPGDGDTSPGKESTHETREVG